MGSSAANQQLGQQKAQKGWLSRWTRKQWSRHWFVLKNGSLTSSRGPAAELCSFLDGVLDLSLIKHIEVPQQEEQVVLAHPHQHQQHPHQQHQLHFGQLSPNFNAASQQHQPHPQAQPEGQAHFNFSLKMWNGECHLLSAASLSERQLWLAAINSCNSYDDDTASSDSSSSSQSSNLSTKSADIGSSHHPGCLAPAAEPSLAFQQQHDKEAEASLEQLALKLKSVVRRRREADESAEEPPAQTLLARPRLAPAPSQKPPPPAAPQATSQQQAQQHATPGRPQAPTGRESVASLEDQQQAHKRRLVCPQSPAVSPTSQIMQVADEPAAESRAERGPASPFPGEPDDQPMDASLGRPRQKKRVTFDLSNQEAESSSAVTSSGSEAEEEAEEGDEEEAEEEAESSLSSVSTGVSGSESEAEAGDEPLGEPREPDARRTPADVGSYLFAEFAGIKRTEMRRQLKYSRQRSSYEDEDSTCELVRRMIERRKMRLQNKEGAPGGRPGRDCDREGEKAAAAAAGAEGAISSTRMETNQEGARPGAELLAKQLELEARLKSAELNADLLEKRLADSYQSYSQLETSYKQLELELLECRELNAKNMAQMEAKLAEMTNELKASELRLLEAREKLLGHEQLLARRQPPEEPPANPGRAPAAPAAPRRAANHWLTKNYSSSVLLGAGGNKLLLSLAQSLAGPQALLAAGGPSQAAHQMKQSLSVSQQQLSLKLLSQSKQIQRKLNELELKVDKIQSGGAAAEPGAASAAGANNHRLINFNRPAAVEAAAPTPAGPAAS